MTGTFLKEIKRNIAETDYLKEYGKQIKVVSIKLNRVVEDSDCIAEFLVKTSFKAQKYEDNISVWKVAVYNDDTMQSFFDRTEYKEA